MRGNVFLWVLACCTEVEQKCKFMDKCLDGKTDDRYRWIIKRLTEGIQQGSLKAQRFHGSEYYKLFLSWRQPRNPLCFLFVDASQIGGKSTPMRRTSSLCSAMYSALCHHGNIDTNYSHSVSSPASQADLTWPFVDLNGRTSQVQKEDHLEISLFLLFAWLGFVVLCIFRSGNTQQYLDSVEFTSIDVAGWTMW